MSDEAQIAVADISSDESIELMGPAMLVTEELTKAYPNYPWICEFQGGALVVRNLAIPGPYAMVLPPWAGYHSYSSFKESLVMAAGEFLERAHLPRGAWNGDMAQKLDGSERRFFRPFPNE